ncbi:hypothetical protein CLV51_107180 [Chitinophaga niastensis]|uniref:Uncharacterized protein n=1 Tax=Chitinophaga niastensis TaxID=536980 RepID=A0A2P8HCB2_CHINA|nr:hypothetical protein CLV51_107180 [Chitinophaga niastensis]
MCFLIIQSNGQNNIRAKWIKSVNNLVIYIKCERPKNIIFVSTFDVRYKPYWISFKTR